ncbi:MAG: hypothetical protein AAGJ54_06020 [Planctomycetota bacterium]
MRSRGSLRLCLAVAALSSAFQGTAALAQTVEVIDLGERYADPELLQEENLMVFQTGSAAWIGTIDPATGLFAEGDGRNWLVDPTISSLFDARNGPEFGLDRDGWSIFYNETVNGRVVITRATPTGPFGSPFARAMLTDVAFDRVNQLPSQDASADRTWVLYGRGLPTGFDRDIAYLDELDPMTDLLITPLRPGFAGFRWIDNTSLLLSTVADGGPANGQIVLIDAATGDREIITNDAGTKFDPYGWIAPEFGGAMLAIAALDESNIAVYREAEPFWERIAVLSPPEASGLGFVQSPEPFVAGGRSYIVTTLKNMPGPVIGGDVTESQIWLYGIDDDPVARFTLRVDDGAPGQVRQEGEAFLGENELFIYYNDVRSSGIGLRLTRTGIRLDLDPACQPADLAPPYGTLDQRDTELVLDLLAAGRDDADLNADGILNVFDLVEMLSVFDACRSEAR